MTTTTFLADEAKADRIIAAIERHGPATQDDLLTLTGLTPGQFKKGWQHVKRQYAPEAEVVAVYDPSVGRYGIWSTEPSAWNGTLNRLNDSLTRLSTIERGSLDGMFAAGLITKRLHHHLTAAIEEYDLQVRRFEGAADAHAV